MSKLTFRFSLSLLFLLYAFSAFSQQRYSISGYIRDASSGEELIGATLVLNNQRNVGVVTNVYGFYSLTLPQGEYELLVSYTGFSSQLIKVSLNANRTLTIEMQPENVVMQEVLVTAERIDQNVEDIKMSRENLKIETIKAMPALFGEVDLIKSIQFLPGITSAGEGTTGLFVRGGSADQNLILLDEATVYNASHLLGFFSVFNPDAIKNVEIYKGGIPARYGGRLSSILDIQMREGNDKRFAGTGGIGSISSRLTLEGPIVKDKSSFIVSGRRTYADVFLKLSNNENLNDSRLYFYDFNAKTNYRINEKNRIFASGYFGRDELGFSDLFGFGWGNATGTFRWNHLFSDKLFMNTTVLYSNYDYRFKVNDGNQKFTWKSALQEYNVKLDFDYFANPDNTLTYGANFIYHTFSPAEIISDDALLIPEFRLDDRFALEGALYIGNEQKINDKLSMQYGLRYSYFANMGQGKVYIYDPNQPKTRGSITDTLQFSSGQIMKFYNGWEPRFGMRYKVGSSSSVKLSYNRMMQYLQIASNSTAGNPTDLWIPADYYFEPLIGDQVAMGYFRNFAENTIETSTEVYYKWMQNIIDFRPGAQILLNDYLEQEALQGRGWAYGVEFMVKKTKGAFNGWVSYTLSRTMRQVNGINLNNPYPARYDKTHDISIVGNYEIRPNLQLGGAWVYATGAAVSFPAGRYFLDGQSVPYYEPGQQNAYRMPHFHRLDLSLNYDIQPRKANAAFKQSVNVSLYNVYNRKNPFSLEFRDIINDDVNYNPNSPNAQPEVSRRPGVVRTSLFGIIPSVTWNFKF